MDRRSFLLKFFLWILTFFFGYKVGVADSAVVIDKSKSSVSQKIDTINESLKDIATLPQGIDKTGTLNSRIIIQDAIDSANGILHLPAGDFLLDGDGSELLLVTKAIKIRGSGANTRLIIKSSVSKTTDIIRLSPEKGNGDDKILWSIEDLVIIPEGEFPGNYSSGRHGIHIDTSKEGQYLSKLTIKNVVVGCFSGNAIKLTNPTNEDGFFTSIIKDNLFYGGGMHFDRIGDSVIIERNTVTGEGIGIEMSAVIGAVSCIISQNNITSSAGAIKVDSSSQIKILNNQIEQIVPYTGEVNSMIYVGQANSPAIIGNNINARSKIPHCIRLGSCDKAIVDNNVFRQGSDKCILIESNSTDTTIKTSNLYISTSELKILNDIHDEGKGTIGVDKYLNLINGWIGNDTNNLGIPFFYKGDDNVVHFNANLKNETSKNETLIAVLPEGFRPLQNVYLPVLSSYNGANVLNQILVTIEGNIMIAGDGIENVNLNLCGISFKT